LETVVEGLNQQPIQYPMMEEFSLRLFKPFPRLIKGLMLRLEDRGKVIPKLGRPPDGKYLQRNALDRASQVVKELVSELRSQDFTLSFEENRKRLN